MKKIIHLTDTHVGFENLATRFQEIVTNIINRMNPDEYIIVHTGDIVEDATVTENYQTAAIEIKRLRDKGFTVLLVPGNHDYGTGANGDRRFVPKFKETFLTSDVTYPIKTIIDDIVFIGLDSMEGEQGILKQFGADGDIGRKQLNRLKAMLDTSEVKNATYRVVYLHHHPFELLPWHKLGHRRALKKALENRNINALLFGHKHAGIAFPPNEISGIPRIYDGGSSTGKQGHLCPHRIIDLSKDPGTDYDAKF